MDTITHQNQQLVFSEDGKSTSDSFLYFDSSIDDKVYLECAEIACDKAGIQSKMKEFALELIQFKSQVDTDGTLALNTIRSSLNLSKSTFNYRIKNLRDAKVLFDRDYRFIHSPKHNKSFCVEINISMEGVIEKPIIEEPKDPIVRPKTYKKILKENNVEPIPEFEPNTQLVRPTGAFLVEQAVPSDRPKEPRQKLATTVRVKTAKGTESIATQIQSLSRVMDAEDLQVLYSVYTLIYHYHNSKVDKYLEQDVLPQNYTPVYIEHILKILNRPTGGRARRVIRESLQAIKDTTFDFIMLESVNLIDERLDGFVSKTYRNFDQCSPLSSKDAVIKGDDVEFGKDAMIYMVSLPKHMFISTVSNERLFVFPPASLTVHSLVFSIYLRFRSLSISNDYREALKNTYKDMAKYTSFQSFKKALKTHLLSINKIADVHLNAEYNEDLETIHFNLWGYSGIIVLKNGYEEIQVSCDQKVVHLCCKLKDNTRTPTIDNELGFQLLQSDKIKEQIEKTLRKGIKPYRIGKFDIEYKTRHESFKLTRYSDIEDIELAASKISKELKTDKSLVLSSIISTLESKVEHLVINGNEVMKTDMDWILQSAKLRGMEFNMIDLIHSINRRITLHDDIERLVFGDGEPTEKLVKALQEIVE